MLLRVPVAVRYRQLQNEVTVGAEVTYLEV
jgi:hypothetical protein